MKQSNTLTPETPEKYTGVIIGALADAFEKSVTTIERWIRLEDDRLTSEKARRVYEQFGQQS